MAGQKPEVTIEEVVKALSYEIEAIITVLEKNNLVSREEIFAEILKMKNRVN